MDPGMRWAMRVGIEIVTAMMLGLGLGWFLDRRLGTFPWMILLFGFFGLAGGLVNLWRVLTGEMGRRDGH